MPTSFSTVHDPPIAETADEGGGSFRDSEPDDDFSESGTEASVSDYEGNVKGAPLRMFFGPKECLRIFEQPADRGTFVRVCGRSESTCKRNHSMLERAREGFYDTVASRKYVDGRLHTFQSKQERSAELQKSKASRDAQLAESVKYLTSIEDGDGPPPTSGRKASPASPHRTPTSGLKKGDEDDSLPAFVPHSSLKQAPAYSTALDDPDPPVPDPSSPNPQGLGAMEFMVSALTDTLQGLRNDMKDLKGHVSPQSEAPRTQAPVRTAPSSDTPPTRSEQVAVGNEPTEWWYAVGKGKNGGSGVFPSWTEASDLVLGTSGALVKKFRDYDKAVEFVLSCRAPEPMEVLPILEPSKESTWYAVAKGKHGICNIFQSWEEASEFFLGVPGALVQKFKTRAEALEFLESNQQASDGGKTSSSPSNPQSTMETPDTPRNPPVKQASVDDKNYRPPMALTGPDPSAKKSDEVFGLDLGSELDLRAALLPPDLPEGVSKGLANALVDVIAIPGGFTGGTDESEGNEMALLGEAMEELVSQGRNQMEGAAKADLHWRSGKRTSLRQVKSLDMLRKRVNVLLKLRDKVIKHTIIAVRNACKRGGWQDAERIEAWAHGGYITRITRDALDYYLSLHQHLMGLFSAGAPWDYVKMELDHHVEELDLIRSTADSRLQAILFLYAYLRDGQNKNWHSDSLQYKRNMDIFARHGEGVTPAATPGDDVSTLGSNSGHCPKCGTGLHSGGKANCPWNAMSDAQAKKNANKVIRNMANPTPAPAPSPAPS
jgi:hypothetical protein